MGIPLRIVAVVLTCVGMAGCVRTTEGSVAMTTEPGGTSTTSTTTSTPRPTSPTSRTRTSAPTSTTDVPAPPGALTMKCDEFVALEQPTRVAVVKEILKDDASNSFGPLGADFAESIANTMCQFLPDETVKEVLTGSSPP
jgi:hypothetical protein